MRAGGRHTRRRYKQKLVSHCRHAGFLQQMEIIYPRQSQSPILLGAGKGGRETCLFSALRNYFQ